MRILGLDPGSRFTGFGVVEKAGRSLRATVQGRIRLSRDRSLAARLARLHVEVVELIRREEPDVVVLEALFGGVNLRSLIALAQARGVILGAVAGQDIELFEYSPAEIKNAVTGNGRADKQQVERMVRMVLGLEPALRLSADASDALAAAICAAQRLSLDRLAMAGGRSSGTRRGPGEDSPNR